MARLTARGLLFVLAALTSCAAPAQPPASPPKSSPAQVTATAPAKPEPAPAAKVEPVRAAPTRPVQLWPFTELQGVDYVSVGDLAARFNLKVAWARSELAMTLSDATGVRITFETNQRDFYFDGVRVFLGDPVLLHKNRLWVSKLDVIKIIAPLIRPADQLAHLPAAPKLIVLDAGHGGNDPGKQNLKLKLDEKDMTLDVVLRLKKLLEVRGYVVQLTRSDDTRLAPEQRADLEKRTEFANRAKADLFLSVHFNAVDPRDAQRVNGTETYVLTPQFQVSTQPEQDKTMLKAFYPGNRHDIANTLLGYNLHRQFITGLKASDRGYKRYRYGVLRFLECPGALIEAAYLSNDKEAARVATPAFRQQIAEAIAEGVQSYAVTLAALRPTPAPDPARPR